MAAIVDGRFIRFPKKLPSDIDGIEEELAQIRAFRVSHYRVYVGDENVQQRERDLIDALQDLEDKQHVVEHKQAARARAQAEADKPKPQRFKPASNPNDGRAPKGAGMGKYAWE